MNPTGTTLINPQSLPNALPLLEAAVKPAAKPSSNGLPPLESRLIDFNDPRLSPAVKQERLIASGMAAGPAIPTFEQQRMQYTPDPNYSGTGGGAGGVGGAGGMGGPGISMVDQKRQLTIDAINRGAEAQLGALDKQLGRLKDIYGQGQESVQGAYGLAEQSARDQEQQMLRQAREQNQNARLQSRITARASGVTGSAFAELNNELDQELARNVNDIGTSTAGIIGNANQVRTQALADLANNYQNLVAKIEADRAMTLRDKYNAIAQAKIAAIEEQFDIQRWFESRATASQPSDADRLSTLTANATRQILNNPNLTPAQQTQLLQQYDLRATNKLGANLGAVSGAVQGYLNPVTEEQRLQNLYEQSYYKQAGKTEAEKLAGL